MCIQKGLAGLVALASEHPQKTPITALVSRFDALNTKIADAPGGTLAPSAIEADLDKFLGVKSAVVPPVGGPMPKPVEPAKPIDKPMPKDPPKNVAPGELDFG
jgi:hypothetical protein